MTASGAARAWIGLNDEAHEGRYVWATSGIEAWWFPWDSITGDPQGTLENCVAMHSNGWWDMDCDLSEYAMCEFYGI